MLPKTAWTSKFQKGFIKQTLTMFNTFIPQLPKMAKVIIDLPFFFFSINVSNPETLSINFSLSREIEARKGGTCKDINKSGKG